MYTFKHATWTLEGHSRHTSMLRNRATFRRGKGARNAGVGFTCDSAACAGSTYRSGRRFEPCRSHHFPSTSRSIPAACELAMAASNRNAGPRTCGSEALRFSLVIQNFPTVSRNRNPSAQTRHGRNRTTAIDATSSSAMATLKIAMRFPSPRRRRRATPKIAQTLIAGRLIAANRVIIAIRLGR